MALPLSATPPRVGERMRGPLVVGALGVGAVSALHLRDPHQSGSWGFCPFRLLTGQPCPGCGGLRAVNDLTNGDVVGALSSNAMAVVLVVVGSVMWAAWGIQRLRGQPVWSPRTVGRVSLLLAAGFLAMGAFRLTPWGAWLRP